MLIDAATAAAAELRPLEASRSDDRAALPSTRELFLELAAISLGNLYGKTPIAGQLYDRAMLKILTAGLEDAETSKLTGRAEDWLRLEGVVRAAEGQKAYTLTRPALAVLSTATPVGTLGEILERICRCYSDQSATPSLRLRARELGSYFMTRIARS